MYKDTTFGNHIRLLAFGYSSDAQDLYDITRKILCALTAIICPLLDLAVATANAFYIETLGVIILSLAFQPCGPPVTLQYRPVPLIPGISLCDSSSSSLYLKLVAL